MIATQYPYVDNNGVQHDDKIKIYSDVDFQILQKETERIFDYVVDVYPSVYNYEETDIVIEPDIFALIEELENDWYGRN